MSGCSRSPLALGSTAIADVRPRKRIVQERSRTTVAAIIEAAARILADDGLDAVPTNAVAERAGVSVGSLYQYYPSRDAILADLLRDKLAVLADEVAAVANGRGPDGERDFDTTLCAMLRALACAYIERPTLASALLYVETLIGADEEIAALRATLGLETVAFHRAHNVRDPELAARVVAALARGMALAAGLSGERDADALVARMERAVWGYLGM